MGREAQVLEQLKGLHRHVSLGVGYHLLGNGHKFGLRNRQLGLRIKHGSLEKRLEELVHEGQELGQKRVLSFQLPQIQELRVNKGESHWGFEERHHFALRKGGLLNFVIFHYFRLEEREQHVRLDKVQGVLWQDRDGLSIRIE